MSKNTIKNDLSEWKEVRLGDVLSFGNGKRRPNTNGSIPIYGGNGILGYTDDSNYQDETIVIGRVGAYCGAVYYETNPIWVSDNALSAKPQKNNNLKFLYYFLKDINLNQYAGGSSHPLVTQTLLNSLEFDICTNPSEQKAIAEVLSSLDDKIDLHHRQNKTLEQMAETLFRQWFIERKAQPSLNPSQREGSEEAKEDWEERPLSFFGEIICGKTPSKKRQEYFNGEIPFIKIPDMHGKIFIFDTDDSLSEEGKNSQIKKTLPPKSICVSCIATVGLVVLTTKESHTNQQINSIIPYKNEYRYYLFLQMKSSYDLLHAMASGGTATLNLNTGNFAKIEIPLPPRSILNEFHNKIESLFDKIYKNQQQIRTLEKLRDTLLPKLMSGEVRVKM